MTARRRVIVTRTQPAAASTASALEELGHDQVVIPLQQLTAIPLPGGLGSLTGAVIFTSANALRFLPADCPRNAGPCFCVGDTTAEAARAAGFLDVRSARGDGSAVVELVRSNWRRTDGPITHLGHARPRGDVARRLVAQGYRASHVALYDAGVPDGATDLLVAELSGRTPRTILVHSPAAAGALRPVLEKLPAFTWVDVITISRAAAEPLSGLKGLKIAIADFPAEAAMFRLLKTP